MMVWEVEELMPLEEFDDWLTWFRVKAETEKAAMDKANRGLGVSSL